MVRAGESFPDHQVPSICCDANCYLAVKLDFCDTLETIDKDCKVFHAGACLLSKK